MTAHRGRHIWQVLRKLSVRPAVPALVGMAAVIAVAVFVSQPWAASSGSLASVNTFVPYTQTGSVRVDSISEGDDDTWLAVGTADGSMAIWRRRGASGAWTLVSANSPSVSALSGALTGVAYGKNGWIAVGEDDARQPVVATSGDGMNWSASTVNLPSTFPGAHDPAVASVAADPNGYVIVGTQVSGSRKHNATAALWWSADLRSWHRGNNDYGYTLNGNDHPSSVDAVVALPDGTFAAVGSGNTDCATWTTEDERGEDLQDWLYKTIMPPPGASSARLSLITVSGTVAVAAGYAVIKGVYVPIVEVRRDGQWAATPIQLRTPNHQGTVTALAGTDSGFIVAGEIGPAGARHAVTWSLPDGLNSSWPSINPVPVSAPRDVLEITALSTAGGMLTGAAEQGPAEIVINKELPRNLGPNFRI